MGLWTRCSSLRHTSLSGPGCGGRRPLVESHPGRNSYKLLAVGPGGRAQEAKKPSMTETEDAGNTPSKFSA